MLEFVPLYTKIWSDKKFKILTRDAKLLFFYLFANESVTLTGIYELDLDVCKLKVNLNSKFGDAFNEIAEKKFIAWDESEEVVWVVNRFKLIPTKSPKVIVGVINELNQLKHPFKEEFLKKYDSILKPFFFKLDGFEVKKADFLSDDMLINLHKIYHKKEDIKNFLLNRGVTEQKIDEILPKVFPK